MFRISGIVFAITMAFFSTIASAEDIDDENNSSQSNLTDWAANYVEKIGENSWVRPVTDATAKHIRQNYGDSSSSNNSESNDGTGTTQ